MPAVWTVEGDSSIWRNWARRMAVAGPSPLAGRVLADVQVPAGAWALDVGCGTGRAFAALSQTGARVIGLDPVMEGLRASRARAESDGIAASPLGGVASALPLPGGSIRLALSVGVLFHLGPRELPAALMEIRRVLAPDGEAILHFLDLDDWRRSLGVETPPERVPHPAFRALVTCFATDDTICEWIADARLRLDRLDLDIQPSDPGEQRSWIAWVQKAG